MATRVVIPPAIEPITATEAKLHTRIDNALEDNLVNLWIKSGREMAEGFQNRCYIERTLELTLDKFPSPLFSLALPPLISVESIKYYDEDNAEHTVDPDNYFVDTKSEPGRVSLKYGKEWPTTKLRALNGVVIQYKAGYGDSADDVPQSVKDALLVYVTYRYYNREAEGDSPPPQFHWLLWSDRMVPV